MKKKFKKHIQNRFPFLKKKKILVAISGGVDSVVLTELLNKEGYSIALAHCNFKLRANQSDEDENFVNNIATKYKLPIYCKSFETKTYAKKHKLSTQLAARELRYRWFNELLLKHSFDYIATAHHADDNLETFLINLSRSTGLEGLLGIPEHNRKIIRPLLIFSRDEIITFATENNIDWREDLSNLEIKYLRNQIRHKVVPELKELHPTFLDNFIKTISYLNDSQKIISEWTKRTSNEVISYEGSIIKINIEKLELINNNKKFLYHFLKDYNFTQWNDIYHLTKAQTGKKIFSDSYVLLKNRNYLLLTKKNEINHSSLEYLIDNHKTSISTPIHISLKVYKDESLNEKSSIIIDKNLVTFPLILRTWRENDYFYPTKMKGKKKISKYFKDQKLSEFEKRKTWLLCSGQEIIWVIGMRQDRRFLTLPQNNTSKILISIHKTP